MPSLSFLKARNSQPTELQDEPAHTILEEEPFERAQSKQSKREFLRTLIRKPGVTGDEKSSRSSRWRNKSVQKPEALRIQPASPVPLLSPTSDPNKPLPTPPIPGSTLVEAPYLSPSPAQAPTKITKLARIISPITQADLHKLFFGAPQFFVRSEVQQTGAPIPSVAYPWNTENDVANFKDSAQIQDEAWGSITTFPHVPASAERDHMVIGNYEMKRTTHFPSKCQERPNMLSMQGIERGSMGFVAALEMAVADDLKEIPEENPHILSEQRRRFLKSKQGVRPIADSTLVERLIDISTIYHGDASGNERPTHELYTELFTQMMFPPSRVTDVEDPYSLQVQIDALIDVLATPKVWYDLRFPDSRMRVSQILWGPRAEPESNSENVINSDRGQASGGEKYWLLLQILLSSELLLRLDMLSGNAVQPSDSSENSRFDQSATPIVKWSLVLARTWLENMRVERKDSVSDTGVTSPTGWLATLTGITSKDIAHIESVEDLKFDGRYQIRQLAGLLHFARNLDWPNMESLMAKVATNGIQPTNSERLAMAATAPGQTWTSHFLTRQPGSRRGAPYRDLSIKLHPAGWLSSSYISGLILPGDILGHLLISTLLENDEAAVAKLGDRASLFGGFVYAGQSFWSTRSVVGRVLAARKGSHESMGWISSAVVPNGVGEGWFDIETEPARSVAATTKPGAKPRLWHKSLVESSGSVIGGADAKSVLPGDFVLPSDESIPRSFSTYFHSMKLLSASEPDPESVDDGFSSRSSSSGPAQTKNCSALMHFTIETDFERNREISLALRYDVRFVTAYPCLPSPHLEIIRTPTSPNFQESEKGSIRSALHSSGHPLHKAFTYTRVSILNILLSPATTSFSTLLSPNQSLDPSQSSTHTTSSGIRKVLVIDCTETSLGRYSSSRAPSPAIGAMSFTQKPSLGSDLEMLARALCAERGWNALISRRGRGCISCAVREAGALGWRVIIRLA
ncbi:hypothetical protein GLAREA_01437 [Glarea lozoyensis ATCC 20868]|uniref:Uncharacterized protein n=1 Tax=Glarea lozoyensis (strain ATCC 20868 / MF5171) TaxID=1116229 RepID=S3CI48_GLAL2|nr:uncharacterized protein GLAREA_01437 [Glarea lozoyensis ATCC 20868]EPE25525.1 hypothetical protein GLAREA_01437 [Glarea lozoyensis ATCC 20868]